MSKQRPVGLAAAGAVRASFLVRVPRLHEKLGPVAAASHRVASRMANLLQAGWGARSFDDLHDVPTLLIASDRERLPDLLDALLTSGLSWEGKAVLLCGTGLDSTELGRFRARGSTVGTVAAVVGSDDRRLIAEGDPPALNAARRLFEGDGIRVLQIKPGAKYLYHAGVTFASSLIATHAALALDCLRESGITGSAALELVERAVTKALRSYLKAGAKGWTGPLAEGICLDRMRAACAAVDADGATVLEICARHAWRRFGRVGGRAPETTG